MYIRSKIGYNIKSADFFFFLDFSLSNMMHDCIWILILWRIKGGGGGVVFDEWWTLSYNYYFSTIQLLYQWGPYFSHSGCVIWKKTTTTKKQILNIKLGDQFFFLSKFDLIPCRIFLFRYIVHKVCIF